MQRIDLTTYFKDNLFSNDIKANSKQEAIAELLDMFVESKYIRNREIVLEMLHQRETLGSTGIGKGVAIPHGRTTAASDVLIAFGKSEKGLDFNAIDHKPVHLSIYSSLQYIGNISGECSDCSESGCWGIPGVSR